MSKQPLHSKHIPDCCFLEPAQTYNSQFVPRWEGPSLSRSVVNYRIQAQERSCSCRSLDVCSLYRITLPQTSTKRSYRCNPLADFRLLILLHCH